MKWAVLFVLAAAAGAQEPQFQTHVREVVVPVSVMTKSGKPVESLGAGDFVVLSDGKPQVVRMVSQDVDPLPIYAVLVLQANGGSDAAMAKIKKTASVVSEYITNDIGIGRHSLAAVITAGDEVRTVQEFTADPFVLDDTFDKIKANGGSARLLDGVSLACDLLSAKKEPARRVIVLIGESRDAGSKTHFADAVLKAQRNDIVIYTLSYSAFTTAFTQKASERMPPADQPGTYNPDDKGGANLLAILMVAAQYAKVNIADALAQATGGGHQKFTTLRGLETQLTTIGTEMHNRYALAFVPPEPQPTGYHRLSVSVRKPGDVRVHARAGYWTSTE